MALSGPLSLMRSVVGSYRSSLCSRCAFPLYQQNATLKQSAEEKLGLPVKPKKPLTPYFRYMAQMRSQVAQSFPQAKVTEIVQVIAKKWAEVDPNSRQKLEDEYKKEMEVYATQRLKYEQTLTNEQREELKQARYDKVENKEKRNLKKKMKEFGKPKKPMTGFIAFMKAKQSARGETPFKEWQLQMAKEWENLNESERNHYAAQGKIDMESYKRELRGWEEKMIRLGHIDLVRNEALIQPKHQSRRPRVKEE